MWNPNKEDQYINPNKENPVEFGIQIKRIPSENPIQQRKPYWICDSNQENMLKSYSNKENPIKLGIKTTNLIRILLNYTKSD